MENCQVFRDNLEEGTIWRKGQFGGRDNLEEGTIWRKGQFGGRDNLEEGTKHEHLTTRPQESGRPTLIKYDDSAARRSAMDTVPHWCKRCSL
jgi:hypothetical protein